MPGISLLNLFTFLCSWLQRFSQAAMFPKENSGKADANAWGYMGIGGGGAMFYPAVSPHNPDLVFVSCDMTGSYVTYNGGESWRAFNLRRGYQFLYFRSYRF